jgi:hypothetical protein
MVEKTIYIAAESPALIHAAVELNHNGIPFTADPEEADVLLYSVPTPPFLRDEIPIGPMIIGGNLDFLDPKIQKFDLLKDPDYLALNALLTAEAALGLLLPKLECSFTQAHTLILGWGRIGKCLDQLLRRIGIPVSVYARKPEDRAMLGALGYTPVTKQECVSNIGRYKCIINTAPASILSCEDMAPAAKECICMDLASTLSLTGPGVIHARGLPGKYKAEASGKLIAKTILKHFGEVL